MPCTFRYNPGKSVGAPTKRVGLQASLNTFVIGCVEMLTFIAKMHLFKGFSQQKYVLPKGCVGYSTYAVHSQVLETEYMYVYTVHSQVLETEYLCPDSPAF